MDVLFYVPNTRNKVTMYIIYIISFDMLSEGHRRNGADRQSLRLAAPPRVCIRSPPRTPFCDLSPSRLLHCVFTTPYPPLKTRRPVGSRSGGFPHYHLGITRQSLFPKILISSVAVSSQGQISVKINWCDKSFNVFGF